MNNNFESKFGHKIKTIKELKKEIGNFPRKKKLLCVTEPLILYIQGT